MFSLSETLRLDKRGLRSRQIHFSSVLREAAMLTGTLGCLLPYQNHQWKSQIANEVKINCKSERGT
jgi:hypothetical protein